MWNKIKWFIFEKPKGGTLTLDEMRKAYDLAEAIGSRTVTVGEVGRALSGGDHTYSPLVQAALEHYCEHCNRGFRTKSATILHKRAKHK